MSRHAPRAAPVVLAAALASLIGPPASAQTTLIFNQYLPRASVWFNGMFVPWAKSVEEATGGRVKVEFSAAALGPAPRQFDLVEKGVADVAWMLNSFEKNRIQLHEVAELPNSSETAEAAAVALWRTHERHFAKANEHKGVKLIGVTMSPSKDLFNNKRAITKADDIKGLKLHIPPHLGAPLMEKLGAVVVVGSQAQTYEILSKGTVDGTFTENSTMTDFKLSPLTKHVTSFSGSVISVSFSWLMNEAKWNTMAKADQDAVMKVSGEAIARLSRAWDARDAEAKRLHETGGQHVFTKASPAFMAEIAKAVAPLEAEWIAKAKAKGIDGEAARKFFLDEIKRASGKS